MLLPDSAPVCAPAESIAGVLRKEGLDVGSASVLILRGLLMPLPMRRKKFAGGSLCRISIRS